MPGKSRQDPAATRGTGTTGDDPMDGLAGALVLLLVRIVMAGVFWSAGRDKADGFLASHNTQFTFEFDYRLPLVNPYAAAHAITVGEQVLAVLLLAGLATRASAAFLLALTAVYQIWISGDGMYQHTAWAIALFLLIARGGGRFSLDRLIAGRGTARPE